MPPLYTSTTLSTLLRKAASAAKHLPTRIATGRLARAQRLHLAVRQTFIETFPSLHTPAHQLGSHPPHHFLPHKLASRSVHVIRPPTMRFSRALNAFGSAPALAGPARISQVGLGSARTFAYAAGPAPAACPSLPVTFRALWKAVSDDEWDTASESKRMRILSRNWQMRARGAAQLRRQRRFRPSRRGDLCDSPLTSTQGSEASEFSHYFRFPSPVIRAADSAVPLPPKPEELVTPGTTATLVLPLAHSFHNLMHPETAIPYVDAELGSSIFANLTRGLVPRMEVYSHHNQQLIFPLLHRIEAYGLFDPAAPAKVEATINWLEKGEPDTLRIVFYDRSEADVKAVLGEALSEHQDGQWWALWDESDDADDLARHWRTPSLPAAGLRVAPSEMLEDWSSPPLPPSPLDSGNEDNHSTHDPVADWSPLTVSPPSLPPSPPSSYLATDTESDYEPDASDPSQHLVIPTIDMSATFDSASPSALGLYPSPSPDESFSWPATPTLSHPTSPPSPSSPSLFSISRLASPESSSSSAHSFTTSLDASLISSLSSSYPSPEAEGNRWTVRPTEEDSDLESSVGTPVGGDERMWVFDEAEAMERREDEGPPSPGASWVGGWSGTESGFGLARPW